MSNSDSPHILTPKGVVFRQKSHFTTFVSIHNTPFLNQGSDFSLRKMSNSDSSHVFTPREVISRKNFSRGWLRRSTSAGGAKQWLSDHICRRFESRLEPKNFFAQSINRKILLCAKKFNPSRIRTLRPCDH
jgi:hypothetical protein